MLLRMRPVMLLAALMATLPCVAAAASASGEGSVIKGAVVSGGCRAPIENVRIGVSFKGKLRPNVVRSGESGYFEIHPSALFPDWVPGSSVVLNFDKKGYVSKHRNVQPHLASAVEIPLEKVERRDTVASPFEGLAAHRKDDCADWTVFAVPHRSSPAVEFPDYDQAQEMHFRISTYLQELDLPIDSLPDVGGEWLEQARDLKLTGSEPDKLGTYLNALAVLYGNVDEHNRGGGTGAAQITSYLYIVSESNKKIGATRVAQKTPVDRIDDELFKENSDYMKTLTRTTLLAVISKELDRARDLPDSPAHAARLQRIRDFIIAQRKTFPKPGVQSSVDRSNFQVLNQLAAAVDLALGDRRRPDTANRLALDSAEH